MSEREPKYLVETMRDQPADASSFRKKLSDIVNMHSLENVSNTPDVPGTLATSSSMRATVS